MIDGKVFRSCLAGCLWALALHDSIPLIAKVIIYYAQRA